MRVNVGGVTRGGSGARREARTALAHEVVDDAVERGALKVQRLARLAHALLARAEGTEVLCVGRPSFLRCSDGVGEVADNIICWTQEKGSLTSAVFGTTSARRVISMRPAGAPPMVISKKTTGVPMMLCLWARTGTALHVSICPPCRRGSAHGDGGAPPFSAPSARLLRTWKRGAVI